MSPRPSLCLALLAGLTLAGCIIHIDAGDWDSDAYASRHADRGPRRRGNGVAGEQARVTGPFDAVQVSGHFDVRVTVGQPRSVRVLGDENLLEFVRTEVRGGSLEVFADPGDYRGEHDLWVEVCVPDLRALAISGSGDAALSGLDREAVAFSISGSGDLTAAGRVDSLTIDCAGSGDADLSALAAEEAAVVVSGSSTVVVAVSGRLDVSISGSGDVRYRGRPAVTARISGSGDVEPD